MSPILRVFSTLLIAWLITQAACTSPVIPTPAPPPLPTSTPLPDGATAFRIVSVDSKVQYVVEETFFENASAILPFEVPLEPITTIGTTRSVSGVILLDLNQGGPQIVGGEIEVDLLTLRTGEERRDERIRSDWLSSYRFPTASFRVTGVVDDQQFTADMDEVFQLAGELTVRDVTVPIVLDAIARLDSDSNTIDATASVPLRMSQFGMEPPSMAGIVEVEDAFELRVVIKAVNR